MVAVWEAWMPEDRKLKNWGAWGRSRMKRLESVLGFEASGQRESKELEREEKVAKQRRRAEH